MPKRPPAWLTTIGAVVAVGVFGWTILSAPDRPAPRAGASLDERPMTAGTFERRIRSNFEIWRYDEAIKTTEIALQTMPTNPSAWRYRAIALEYAGGREEEARDAWKRLLELTEEPPSNGANDDVAETWLYHRAWALHGLERDGAAAMFRRLANWLEDGIDTGEASDLYRLHYNLACYRAMAGEHEAAFEALRAAFAHGWDDLNWLRTDPDLDPLRTPALQRRYQDILMSGDSAPRELGL